MSPDGSIVLSVIIVNWNTREFLRKCLEFVETAVKSIPSEIIVIDNASTDGSIEMLVDSFPNIHSIINKTNNGFAAANNLGLHRASGEYVMLLNPDAELKIDSASKMLEFAEAHPEAGVVGPKLLNTDGSLQKNGQKFPTLARELLHVFRLNRLMQSKFDIRYEWGRADFDVQAEVDSVCGACMLVKRAAIEAAGLLDERFFMYYEEVDWCKRIKAAGWKVYYLPESEVIHHIGQGSKQIGLKKMRIAYASQYVYFKKHHGLAQALVLRIISGMILALMRLKKSS